MITLIRMAPLDARDKEDLARLHQEWQEVHAKLRVQEQTLSLALERYAKGKGERPDALMKEISEMRAECSTRFNRLMQAMRTAPPGPPPQQG